MVCFFSQNEIFTMSLCRQNFSKAAEDTVNDQINAELNASYVYQSLAAYFDRDDVALPGFRDFFQHSSDEERDHAQKFIKYQNKRGGRVVLKQIKTPPTEWSSPLSSLEAALALEKDVNERLFVLHKIADDNNDAQFSDYIDEFLEEQVDAEKKLADLITNLKRVGDGLGVFLFDKEMK
jgi:ferritin heavy chain